jgi:hypothetical protein
VFTPQLAEVRQREAIDAKRIIAQFVVDHATDEVLGFGKEGVNLAREFLAGLRE